jgi:tripartite-type tricarboxylate transporter receptor subunit TctC
MISTLRVPTAIVTAVFAVLAAHALMGTPFAAEYPVRSITFIVPGPVAGTTDTLCRMVADKLRGPFGRPVVVENRPGGVGSIGASAVAAAQPDGHTLLCTPDPPIVQSPLVNRSLSYDAQAFAPVISLAVMYSVIAVRRDFPADSVAGLVAYAKANPGRINYASGGNSSGSHMAARQLACLAGIEMVNIPYPGSAPSQRALVGGEVDVLIDGLPVLLSAHKAGLVKIVAVSAPARVAEMPDIPTLAESGLGNIEFKNWFGIFAPRDTPVPIVAKLNRAVNDVLELQDVRARVDAWALRLAGGTPLEFEGLVAQDRKQREQTIEAIAARHCR